MEADAGTYVVTDGQRRILTAANSEDARAMAALAKRHEYHCSLGVKNQRPDRARSVMEYWMGRSEVEVDPPPQSDCISYDPSDLGVDIVKEDKEYVLTDGGSRMRVFDNLADLKQALRWAQKHDKYCFIGRDNDRPAPNRYIAEFWAGGGEEDTEAPTGRRPSADTSR